MQQDIRLGHKCKEMNIANERDFTEFSVEYYSSYISIFNSNNPPTRGEPSWKLLNNEDDYYSAEHIGYCPYCGMKLDAIK